MKLAQAVTTPLEMASRVADTIRSVQAASLPEYTAPTRLSPIVLIDKKMGSVDEQQQRALLQTLLSIYTAQYLQAINISSNVGSVNVIKTLDKFATDRDILRALGTSSVWSNECFKEDATSLPKFGTDIPFSLEAGSDKENIKQIQDQVNLAVGKLIEVVIQEGDNKISIPVQANLIPKSIGSDDIINITSLNGVDKSLKGRWHQWRSGEIRFVPDYLLALDLIEMDLKALKADPTGTLLQNRSKRTKNILAAISGGQASPNVVSTMMIVTKETAKEMEFQIKGKFSSPRIREQYFKSNMLMTLVVVDPALERFTLHQRGIADSGIYTFQDIKGNDSRANGVDIDSVLKAYKLGEAPTL